MALRLSDDELRKSLRELGEKNVGPITPTTRSALERRLEALSRSRSLNALSSDDSEVEGPPGAPRRKRALRRSEAASVNVPVARTSLPKTPKLSPPTQQKRTAPRHAPSFEVETSDSELETPKLQRRPLAAIHSTVLNSPVLRRGPAYFSPAMGPSHLYTPTLERLKRAGCLPPPSNGFLSPSDGGKEEQGRSTDHSRRVSWVLLCGTVGFFVLIGLLYMSEVNKITQNNNTQHLKFCKGVEDELCSPLIFLSRELHNLLSTVAGSFECGYGSSRSMSVTEAKAYMKKLLSADGNFQMEQFEKLFELSLKLFKDNPQWDVTSKPNGFLEAEHGAKSLWCRAQLALKVTLTKLLMVAAVCGAFGAGYLGWTLWKRHREAQEKLFYEMVENVIDILREPSPEDSNNCKAVVNVRDTLIPAKERRSRQWLWDRVVRFIEENESRVSVEFHTIHGEEFKVWRWNTPQENEGGRQGKVWQGQAFSSPEKGKSAPTPCLKIRNMFDPEVANGDDWQVKDAILEKCEGNDGIVHMATNNEGCVYMMCSSLEAAGKAYNDLHGWWFDGKLVTVKYLKRGRYVERFPDSAHSSRPLRPSNDRRASLAAPFFSSALERS